MQLIVSPCYRTLLLKARGLLFIISFPVPDNKQCIYFYFSSWYVQVLINLLSCLINLFSPVSAGIRNLSLAVYFPFSTSVAIHKASPFSTSVAIHKASPFSTSVASHKASQRIVPPHLRSFSCNTRCNSIT